jgi:hypothetical protein
LGTITTEWRNSWLRIPMKTLTEMTDLDVRAKALEEIIVLQLAFAEYKLYRWRARGASGGGNDGGTNAAVIASVSGMC